MKSIKELILSLITSSLMIGLLTPVRTSYALDDSCDESIYEQSESYIIEEDESLRDESSKELSFKRWKHSKSHLFNTCSLWGLTVLK